MAATLHVSVPNIAKYGQVLANYPDSGSFLRKLPLLPPAMHMALPFVLLPFLLDASLVLLSGGISLLCLLSALLGFNLARRVSNQSGQGKGCSKSELQALSTLLVPTCSGALLELQDYPLIKSISATKDYQEITLSFKGLYNLICHGIIELRHVAVVDGIIAGRLETNGCKFSVAAPGNNRWQVIRWVLRSHFRNQRMGGLLCAYMNRSQHVQGRTLEPAATMVDLDFIPYPGLKKSIAFIVDSPGQQSFTLCLTCLSPRISLLDSRFPFTVLPLLPKVYHQPSGKIRTTTSLFLSLQYLLILLASNHPDLAIVKVANISSSYAEILQEIENALVDDRTLRTNYIREYGLTGWREQRLRLVWEASLLRQGRLQRWKVTLRR